MSILVDLVVTFALLSILSIGGANATVPEIHRQVVEVHHWMSDATFVQLIAIGQAAPGPNVLIVSMIGWHMAGVAGMLAATSAIVVPSSIIAIGAGRATRAGGAGGAARIVRVALAPIAVGLMVASGIVMTRAAYVGILTLAVAAAVASLVVFTRLSPLWGIAGGAVIGIVGHRLHVFG